MAVLAILVFTSLERSVSFLVDECIIWLFTYNLSFIKSLQIFYSYRMTFLMVDF